MMNKTICVLLVSTALSLASCSSSSDDPDNSNSTTGDNTDGATDNTAGGITEGSSEESTDNSTDGTTDNSTDDGAIAEDAGSGGNNNPVGGDVNLLGLVSVSQGSDSMVDISGVFVRSDLNLPSTDVINGYRPELDTCTLQTIDIGGSTIGLPNIDFLPEFVSAGEVITFIAAGSSFTELQRSITPAQTVNGVSVPELIAYTLPEGTNLTGPVPSDLTLNVPGDVFPSFSAASVPSVEALQVQSPGAEPVTASTTFIWTAGSNADAFIEISAFGTTFDPDTIDPETFDPETIDPEVFAIHFLNCTVTDDGSFTIPTDIQAQMGSAFSSPNNTMSRTAFETQQQGSAILNVSNSSVVTNGL